MVLLVWWVFVKVVFNLVAARGGRKKGVVIVRIATSWISLGMHQLIFVALQSKVFISFSFGMFVVVEFYMSLNEVMMLWLRRHTKLSQDNALVIMSASSIYVGNILFSILKFLPNEIIQYVHEMNGLSKSFVK